MSKRIKEVKECRTSIANRERTQRVIRYIYAIRHEFCGGIIEPIDAREVHSPDGPHSELWAITFNRMCAGYVRTRNGHPYKFMPCN